MRERIIPTIARELDVRPGQVEAAVGLLDGGATVPFIARYRKEVTGGLDDTRLRGLEERLNYLRELEDRRATVLGQIEEQGKLTPELKQAILAADTKTRLEDLYLPYKQKRRTRGEIAREAGLEPLARAILEDPARDPATEAADYLNPDKAIDSTDKALEGARAILAESFAEDPELAGSLREFLWDRADIVSGVIEGKKEEGRKFSDYFDHRERLARVPSHRALALFRGRKEGVLRLDLELPEEDEPDGPGIPERRIAARFGVEDRGRPADDWLLDTVRHTWRVKLLTRLRTDVMLRMRERAEAEAIDVFANNLHDLLLAAPAGPRAVLGIDPGLRTGSKIAVVDATGKVVETATIYPHPPQKQWDRSLAELARLVDAHDVELVAIGNGTASRETERLSAELVKRIKRPLQKIVVSEAGASVYSASETAAREFPDLDVSLRGAVSIARRLQDPLAELVKIEPKSIGVGQYQHDVSQTRLARSLEAVIEDCVNAVGVDANTASAPLLARVSGLGPGLADNVVSYREQKGAFPSRKTLLKVPRFGEKAFEQAAGFLRIRDGEQPLDASAVHPEAYPVVERIIDQTGMAIEKLIGNRDRLRSLSPESFTDDRFGTPTVRDILSELEKPGRDPRPEFKTAEFREGVETVEDLREGMTLEGVVTNVTNFGAFVDIGVHQDGLVHISRMAEKFVRDPRDIARPGDVVRVKVLEIDLPRRRIALTLRLDDEPGAEGGKPTREKNTKSGKPSKKKKAPARKTRNQQPEGALASALKEKLQR